MSNKHASPQHNKITFIVNGNTYHLSASDETSIGNIDNLDRQALITLLDAIKQQQTLSQQAIQSASRSAAANPFASSATSAAPDKIDRVRPGDAEAIMARLIMEEQSQKNSESAKNKPYKWIIGGGILLLLWVIFF